MKNVRAVFVLYSKIIKFLFGIDKTVIRSEGLTFWKMYLFNNIVDFSNIFLKIMNIILND